MEGFNRESRQSIFFGVNYILARAWTPDQKALLEFQQALLDRRLEFTETKQESRNVTLVRREQSALQVRIASLGPQVSNIAVRAERPSHLLELFAKEADAIYEAYRETWLPGQCQVLQSDASIRHLYSCADHAFKYLWEGRLGQKPQDFHFLGKRPVLGGGLRLVMPPAPDDTEPVQIEIKVESFFQESQKMFVETLFVWPQPRRLPEDKGFDPDFRLKRVEKYATNEVCEFILGPEVEG